jgi:hypothetical protein
MRCLGKEEVYEGKGNEGREGEDELHDAPRGVVRHDTYRGVFPKRLVSFDRMWGTYTSSRRSWGKSNKNSLTCKEKKVNIVETSQQVPTAKKIPNAPPLSSNLKTSPITPAPMLNAGAAPNDCINLKIHSSTILWDWAQPTEPSKRMGRVTR